MTWVPEGRFKHLERCAKAVEFMQVHEARLKPMGRRWQASTVTGGIGFTAEDPLDALEGLKVELEQLSRSTPKPEVPSGA